MGKYVHGKRRTRLYSTWTGMKTRCTNKNCAKYKNYGGRGIKICDEWLNNFQSFYDWAMENGYRDDLSIDRINNDGNYEPSNCRWIKMEEQASNKTTNHLIAYNGKTDTISGWARELGVSRCLLKDRICRYGWSVERALTTPARKHKPYETGGNHNGRNHSDCYSEQ